MTNCNHPVQDYEQGTRVCQACGQILIGTDGIQTENEQ